jgi:predicted small lipoprotein YifL
VKTSYNVVRNGLFQLKTQNSKLETRFIVQPGVLMKKILLLLSVVFLLASCGKRGPLVAPEALVPAPINDLQVEQKGNRFQVCWSGPGKQEWGGSLVNLAGFQVFRREVLPPDEDCETCPSAYRQVKTVDPEYLKDVLRLGSLFCFFDTELMDGKTYQYKVISFDAEGAASKDSNRVRRKKTVPPSPPELAAVPAPRGVTLQWKLGELPAGAKLEGFSVFRKQGGEVMPLLPIATVVADGALFEDPHMEHGVPYVYAVRTVAGIDGEKVESDLSNEVEGKFQLSE